MAAEGTCHPAGVALDTRLKSEDWKGAICMTLEETGGLPVRTPLDSARPAKRCADHALQNSNEGAKCR
jgi:hypothetical protein